MELKNIRNLRQLVRKINADMVPVVASQKKEIATLKREIKALKKKIDGNS